MLSGSSSAADGGLPAASGGVAVAPPSGEETQLVLLIDPGESQSLAYATTFGAISIAIEPTTGPAGDGTSSRSTEGTSVVASPPAA